MTALRRSATTQALIDLENAAPPVLAERLPGSAVPFWIQVRMQFTTLLSDNELGDATISTSVSLAKVLRRLAFAFVPSRHDLRQWRSQRDVVFLVGGTTVHERARRTRNWLVGAYAEALPEHSMIVQRAALASRLGRPAFAATRTLDAVLARAELRIALHRGRSSPNDGRVRELMAEFAELLGIGSDPRLVGVTDSAVWAERNRPHVVREFERFLNRARPRVLIVEDASYGDYYASLVAAARSRGIFVAEPQHGWLGPAHAAYNYGALMHRAENAHSLPDVVLTFGEYWSEGLSHPGKIVPVGKPHLEERAGLMPAWEDRPKEVLVVSSVSAADVTLRFLGDLRSDLPAEWSVRFRPHPSERAVLDSRYPGIRSLDGVIVDERPDVFDSLVATRIVVGVASTVLFEAAALGCRVFVRDSPYVPIVVGDLFGVPLSGAADLARVSRVATDPHSTDDGQPRVDVARMWRPNAVENFTQWVSPLISDSNSGSA